MRRFASTSRTAATFCISISRNWSEVTWVAAASYLTRAQARKRFRRHSGDEYQQAEYKVDKDSQEIGGADNRERAKFWEVWDKATKRCRLGRPGLREDPRRGRPPP